jgi:hypothetical protein
MAAMRRYLPLLAVICFWLIAGDDGSPNVAESKLRCEVTYNGRSIETTSPEIGCQSNALLTSTLGEHLIQLIHANSTVIDVSAGFGASYMPLAQLLGDTGTIIAIEKSQELFDMLQRNAVKGEAWSRTLLLNGDPSKIQAGDNAHSITSIVNKLALGCPHLLRFNHHNDVARYETYTALLGAYGVLEHCLPVLLIDCDKSDISGCIATVELLSAVKSATGQPYQLFWHTLETRWAYTTDGKLQEHTDTRATLLALPLGHHATDAVRTMSSMQSVHSRYRDHFDPVLPTLWEEVAGKLSTPTPTVTGLDSRARQTVTVELKDITAWNSTLYRVLGHYSTAVSSAELQTQLAVQSLREAGLHRRVVIYDYAHSDTAETLELVASAYCFLWGSAVHRQLTKTQQGRSAAESAQAFARWQQELGPVQAGCAAFLGKRLRTLHRIITMRTEQQRQDHSTAAVEASGIVVSDEEASASATPYAYYELNAHNTTAGSLQWFERPPLTAQHDDSLCMEPVWCSHTVEFQRRIRAWQFPEEPTAPLAEHVQFCKRLRAQQQHQQQQGGGTDGGSQEEDQPRRRDWSVRANASTVGSCAASKFLVYEPPSHAHGLGSMLELIASTFRYAICLDRILVLNAFNQSGTLTKWIHPGCQGSFAECYFEPLSGCHLNEEEINSAFVSKDGDRFELFPLRDERVLVLKGMPLVGSCSLCHSEWRVESKFFDGLFMGDSGFDPSVALLHMPAFRSAVKQPWASQFLRYLLRPKPWVQEAITQMTQISMRSPAPVIASTSNGTTELPLHAFPKRFLSLHVRFGMKAAEADLQPLSKYMDFVARKLPEMRDIFVSTETDAVIQTLISYVTLSTVILLTITPP